MTKHLWVGLFVAAVGTLSGCGPVSPTGTNPPAPTKPQEQEVEHDHPSTGPAGGPLAEWGEEEYHVEVLADAKTGDVTATVFGPYDPKTKWTAKPIEAKTLSLTLNTTPATAVTLTAKDEAAGKASVFVGKSDAVKTDKKLTGSVSGKVGTKPYTGEFKQK